MGAIARQVPQVKRKNSTKCNPPEARLTVDGSVASSASPREVAMGSAAGARAWVEALTISGVAVGMKAASGCELRVTLGTTIIGCSTGGVETFGAHAANSAMSRLRVRKKRGFIFTSFRKVISGNSYGKINGVNSASHLNQQDNSND